jgi:predicted DNA-binding protein
MKKAKKWKSIRIEAELYDRLRKIADKRKETFSTFINIIFENYDRK